MKKCENCEKEHKGEYGSGRFCSVKCSRGFSSKFKRNEINEKVSLKLKNRGNGDVQILCETCKKEFKVIWRNRNQRFCSKLCVSNNVNIRNKHSEIQKIRCSTIEERIRLRDIGRKGGFGTKGFTEKGIRFDSKLEKICFEYLENNSIEFIPHRNIPDSSKISDLYIPYIDLWIEIDGINREKRKKWIGKDYEYWIEKLKIYSEKNLKLEIVYNLKDLISAINKYKAP